MIRPSRNPLSALCLILPLLSAAAIEAAPDWHWYYYTLDTGAVGDSYSKLRYDSKGDLKVLHRSKGDLYYTEIQETKWVRHYVDSLVGYESKIAMDLDKDGHPHIIHQDVFYSKVLYDTYDGKGWTRRKVDTLTLHGRDFYNINMVVDSKGTSHLLYTTNKDTYNTATYNSVDADGRVGSPAMVTPLGGGKWNSIVLDKDEKPVTSYFVYDREGALMVSYPKGNTGWNSHAIFGDTALYAMPTESYYNCIRRADDSTYYILSHSRKKNKILMSKGRLGDSLWRNEVVDTLIGSTQFSTQMPFVVSDSMIFAATPHVKAESEFVPASSKLYISYKRRSDTTWQTQAVDTAGMVGTHADITLTPEGLPAISYFDYARKRVLLAIARKEAPEDSDHDGIPDYQETAVPITKVRPRIRAPGHARGEYAIYDLAGRRSTFRPAAGCRDAACLQAPDAAGHRLRIAVDPSGKVLLLNPLEPRR